MMDDGIAVNRKLKCSISRADKHKTGIALKYSG
jgi:hypothetical protein